MSSSGDPSPSEEILARIGWEKISNHASTSEMRTVDEVLDEIGALGAYQRKILVIGGIVHGSIAMQSVAFLFVGRAPHTKCSASFTGCRENGDAPGCEWIPNNTHNSYASEFGLVCEHHHLQGILTSVFFCGFGVGASLVGQLCDLYGRKKCAIATALLTSVSLVLGGLAPDYTWLFLFKFTLGAGFGGVSVAKYTWLIEFFTASTRSILTAVLFTSYSVILCLNPLLAYMIDRYYASGATVFGLQNWRCLSVLIAIPALVVLPQLALIEESPRFVASRDPAAALLLLGRIAAANGQRMPQISAEQFRTGPGAGAGEQARGEGEIAKGGEQKKSGIQLLCCTGSSAHGMALWQMACLKSHVWFVVVAVFYGATIFLSGLQGHSLYENVVLSNLIQAPAYLGSSHIARVIGGQKKGMLISLGACCLCSVGFALVGNMPLLAFLSFFFVTLAFAFIYTFSAELFPTSVRAVALGVVNIFGRLGGMAAPQLADLDQRTAGGGERQWRAPLAFGVLAATGVLAVSFLPDTEGVDADASADGQERVHKRAAEGEQEEQAEEQAEEQEEEEEEEGEGGRAGEGQGLMGGASRARARRPRV